MIKKRERARGEMVLAIKRDLKIEVEWKKKESATWEKEGKIWLWGIAYMRHKRKENYKILEKKIKREKESIVIICGDFNTRTAEEVDLWDREGVRESRKSKNKVLNEEGKEMINWMEKNGVGIEKGTSTVFQQRRLDTSRDEGTHGDRLPDKK